MNDYLIRPASLKDAGAIAEIYNESIVHTTATFDMDRKTVSDREQWLLDHDERHPVFVAELSSRVVGWAALTSWSPRRAYDRTAETSFYVLREFHGRGIGRALKERLIEEAKRLNYHTLLALAASESEASIHICQTLGFQHCGTMREVGYKFGRQLDVVILQLMLHQDDENS